MILNQLEVEELSKSQLYNLKFNKKLIHFTIQIAIFIKQDIF